MPKAKTVIPDFEDVILVMKLCSVREWHVSMGRNISCRAPLHPLCRVDPKGLPLISERRVLAMEQIHGQRDAVRY